MKTLSVRQPWAWAIIFAGKDCENRTWGSPFRGRVLIHASKGCTNSEYGDACAFMHDLGVTEVPELEELARGAIVGAATVVDCVEHSTSLWFVGPSAFVLANAKPAPVVVPCVGKLGFFDVPADVAAAIRGAG